MIDMHTHFLFGIDDGAKTMEDSLNMLKEAYNQGVRLCVSTSHCTLHHKQSIADFLEVRNKKLSALKKEIQKRTAKGEKYPQIIAGAEVYLDNDISEIPNIESLCIENTKYMLVEFSRTKITVHCLTEWLYNLKLKGIKPIVAHVERYPDTENVLNELNQLGIDAQINADILLDFFSRRTFKKMLNYRVDYIFSSDMHNMDSRKCTMGKALKKAEKLLEPEICEMLFCKKAQSILGDQAKDI